MTSGPVVSAHEKLQNIRKIHFLEGQTWEVIRINKDNEFQGVIYSSRHIMLSWPKILL